MGAAQSAHAAFPSSTATLCVLPLRTNGSTRFSLANNGMPASLAGRLSDPEFSSLVDGINKALHSLAHFGFLSLLLPFLVVDVITMVLLCAIDPWLLVSPWDYPLADLLLPITLEFCLVFCGFPLMLHVVNRRVSSVQERVRAQLDEASQRHGARGLNFQLKQSIVGNGAGTNMWVEVQVLPLLQVKQPVPVPVPTLYPVLVPSDPAAGAASPSPSGGAPGSSGGASSVSRTAAGKQRAAAAPSTPGSAAPSAPPTPASAAAAGSHGASAMAAEAAAAAASGTLTPQQLEYLRVLQENQMLRQYVQQYQQLVGLQAQHLRATQHQAAQQLQETVARLSPGGVGGGAPSEVGSPGAGR